MSRLGGDRSLRGRRDDLREEAVALGSVGVPVLSGCPDPPAGARRDRWAFWRSPPGQPGWARPCLLGIAAAATVLYARNLPDAGFAPFYSTAVKSMSVSWKAFVYGAFDPAATITIDKLAGSFVPQARCRPGCSGFTRGRWRCRR